MKHKQIYADSQLNKLLQGLVAITNGDINHHIANLLIGLQVLAGYVDRTIAEHLVNGTHDAGHVAMYVEQAMGEPLWEGRATEPKVVPSSL